MNDGKNARTTSIKAMNPRWRMSNIVDTIRILRKRLVLPGSQDLIYLKNEMSKLGGDMVLEIETGNEKAVRSTKVLITKAAKELDTRWRHWHVGSKVFARPIDGINARKRRKAP